MSDNEFQYRMHRLHYRYPRYITRTMYHDWISPTYTGSYINDSRFKQTSPSYSTHTSSSSKSSFGGGSSRGGGGRSGKW